MLQSDAVRQFIQTVYGSYKENSYKRLLRTCQHLGFLGRYDTSLLIQHIAPSPDAFLLLMHDRLAPNPRIVRISDILSAQWWKLLGLRDTNIIRQILHNAESAGLVSRYIKVDELEQVTTRYNRQEYLNRAMRI